MSALAFNNSRVQHLRRLIGRRSARHEEGLFVVEGPVPVAEGVAAGWEFEAQFVPDGSDAAIAGAGSVFELGPGVLERVGSTDSPQPPIAIARMARTDTASVLSSAQLVVVLDRVNDPGNLGTVIRSAEAAGVDAVILTAGSTDHYGPKVVRSSAGAIFHVPVMVADLSEIAAGGLDLIGTSSNSVPGRTVVPYTAFDLTGRIALVMGNEAAGLPDTWTDSVGPLRRWVTIPHRGRSESLNVAMATTVLAFESARQRTSSPAAWINRPPRTALPSGAELIRGVRDGF
jgi:RNA methyltransferase, TrmH family